MNFDPIIRARKLSTLILQGKVEGRSSRDCPRKRWTDGIKEWTIPSLSRCTSFAPNRKLWKQVFKASLKFNHEDGRHTK